MYNGSHLNKLFCLFSVLIEQQGSGGETSSNSQLSQEVTPQQPADARPIHLLIKCVACCAPSITLGPNGPIKGHERTCGEHQEEMKSYRNNVSESVA